MFFCATVAFLLTPRHLCCGLRRLVDRHMDMGWFCLVRLLKTIDLFCKRALQKRRYSAKEMYRFQESTNRSHPISHAMGNNGVRTSTCVLSVCISTWSFSHVISAFRTLYPYTYRLGASCLSALFLFNLLFFLPPLTWKKNGSRHTKNPQYSNLNCADSKSGTWT